MSVVHFEGRPVGRVDAEGVFWRRVQSNQVLRQPPAIALHREVLHELEGLGCKAVAFEMPDGSLLTAPLSVFADRGFPVDRGWGAQVGVLLVDFLRLSPPTWVAPTEVGA